MATSGRDSFAFLDALERESGRELGLPDVAFTNLAKCFCYRKNDTRLVLACQRRVPLAALVKDLNPLIVFIAKSTRDTRPLCENLETVGLKAGLRRRVYQYDNMHGTIWDEEHRQWVTESVWLPEAAAYYATVAPHGRQSSIVKLSIRNTVMEKYSR